MIQPLWRTIWSFLTKWNTELPWPANPSSVCVCVCVCVCVLVSQLCPTLCDPVYSSLPSSSVLGILQARILEWVAMPFSRRSSWPRDWIRVSLLQVNSLPPKLLVKQLYLKKKKYRHLYTEGTYYFSTVGKKEGGNVREIKISMFVFGRTRLWFLHGKNSRVIIIQTSLFSHFCSGRDPGYFYLIIVWFVPVSWCKP